MHDSIYENQEELGESQLLELADALGLSAPALREALSESAFAPRVREDFLSGVSQRSTSTGSATTAHSSSSPSRQRLTHNSKVIPQPAHRYSRAF
jgi:hypothetical protein